MGKFLARLVMVTMVAGGCSAAPDRTVRTSSGAGLAATDMPVAVGAAGPGCRSGGPSLVGLGKERWSGRGDFDGDGRRDIVTVYQPAGPAGGVEALAFDLPNRIRVVFGAGGITDEVLPDSGVGMSDGVVDVNEDGRDEVVIDIGGNTGLSVEFATVVACRVMVALGPDGLPAGFGYYGHSTGYPGSVGTHCLDTDGNGRLDRVIQVASEPVGYPDVNGDGAKTSMDYWLAGPTAVDHYTWERQTYRLETGRFRLIKGTAGRYQRQEGQLDLSNDLVCEPPHAPPASSAG
jgi:hypothetical protein